MNNMIRNMATQHWNEKDLLAAQEEDHLTSAAAEWLTSSSPPGLKVLNIFKSLLSQHSLFLERIGVRRIS